MNPPSVKTKKDGTPDEARPSKIEKGGEPTRARASKNLGLRCRGFGLQRVLGLFDQAIKGDLVTDGEVGKDLAIERDTGGLQAFDESAVANACVAASGVQTNDPKRAKLALLLATVTIGVLPSVLNGFFRVAEELGFITEIASGVFQYFLAALARRG